MELAVLMIDNARKTADLLTRLEAALPVPAVVTPRLAATLRKSSPEAVIPRACQVVWVSNAGDSGGIMCKLSTTESTDSDAVIVTSITHLDFGFQHPLARDIRAYQQHRTKKLRRQNG